MITFLHFLANPANFGWIWGSLMFTILLQFILAYMCQHYQRKSRDTAYIYRPQLDKLYKRWRLLTHMHTCSILLMFVAMIVCAWSLLLQMHKYV